MMNLMKPHDRASLGDVNFKRSVWVAYNSPPMKQINWNRMARLFLKKNSSPFQVDERRSGEREKLVLRRLDSEKKHTFLK